MMRYKTIYFNKKDITQNVIISEVFISKDAILNEYFDK